MKVSVCITVFNEEKSISRLITSLLKQSKKPSEIVIVDGGSTDDTVKLIRHWQKKDKRIRLLVEDCSRAQGRNMAVDLARNSIIAITDAGCRAKKTWLARLTKPLGNKKVDVVAGFYQMMAKNAFQQAEAVFLGVMPVDFGAGFLPSTRSIAFRKKAWEQVGGFPEYLDDTAEDSVFSNKLLINGMKIVPVKNARVEWGMPESVGEFFNKVKSYARGDVKSGVWKHNTKGYMSHNIHSVSIFFRYVIGFIFLLLSWKNNQLFPIFGTLILLYFAWAFRKIYRHFGNWKAGVWGIILQLVSDIAVMTGFIEGNYQ